MALLRGISGDVEGQEVELIDNETTIGRHDNNKVVLPHLSVSSFHCVINKSGDKFTIKDLESTNGTRVDGQKVKFKSIVHGSKVYVGGLGFYFLTDPDTPFEGSASAKSSDKASSPAEQGKRAAAAHKIKTAGSSVGTFKKASKFRGKSLLVIIGVAVVLGLAGLIVLFVTLSKL